MHGQRTQKRKKGGGVPGRARETDGRDNDDGRQRPSADSADSMLYLAKIRAEY